MSRLAQLHEQRAYECRLTPDRALESLDEAEAFARDRGMLTRTADCSLPSVFEACHERPYAAGKGGFAEWPATKWPWFGELSDRPRLHGLKIHNGKSLLVTQDLIPILDPICRAELERMERDDPQWARLLGHLVEAGPSEPEDLQNELGLKPKELKQIRRPLERCGAIVSRAIVHAVVERVTAIRASSRVGIRSSLRLRPDGPSSTTWSCTACARPWWRPSVSCARGSAGAGAFRRIWSTGWSRRIGWTGPKPGGSRCRRRRKIAAASAVLWACSPSPSGFCCGSPF